MKLIDMAGQQFGRVTVLAMLPDGRAKCRCQCGATWTTVRAALRYGRTTSCGCLGRERRVASAIKHGDAKNGRLTAEYRAWQAMLTRCHNPNCEGYEYYGGRGLSVCEEWRRSYQAFLAHVGRKPTSAHSLDRIDNEGNYQPGNVRWATSSQQRINQRPRRRIISAD